MGKSGRGVGRPAVPMNGLRFPSESQGLAARGDRAAPTSFEPAYRQGQARLNPRGVPRAIPRFSSSSVHRPSCKQVCSPAGASSNGFNTHYFKPLRRRHARTNGSRCPIGCGKSVSTFAEPASMASPRRRSRMPKRTQGRRIPSLRRRTPSRRPRSPAHHPWLSGRRSKAPLSGLPDERKTKLCPSASTPGQGPNELYSMA